MASLRRHTDGQEGSDSGRHGHPRAGRRAPSASKAPVANPTAQATGTAAPSTPVTPGTPTSPGTPVLGDLSNLSKVTVGGIDPEGKYYVDRDVPGMKMLEQDPAGRATRRMATRPSWAPNRAALARALALPDSPATRSSPTTKKCCPPG